MELSSLFSDRKTFACTDSIRKFIVNSKNYEPDGESPERTNALLIFNMSKQHTWLVASERRLYCILDDIRKPAPNINWSMSRDDIIEDDEVALNLTSRDKSNRTGLVDIGERHKGWLFSKGLFSCESVEAMVKEMLQRSMLLGEFK